MNDIYSIPLLLRAEHVDFRRRMTLPALMELFQQCCIAHTEQLGMGRDKTLDKGFLWVVNSVRFQIERFPEYDEEVLVESHPGKTLHYFFPRYLVIKDKQGKTLLRGASVWSLIDEKTRSFIDPAKHHIVIEGVDGPEDLAPKVSLPAPALEQKAILVASPSHVDINGHLNNAAYASFILDHMDPDDVQYADIKEFCIQFKKELPLFASTEVQYGREEDRYYFHSPNFGATIDFA